MKDHGQKTRATPNTQSQRAKTAPLFIEILLIDLVHDTWELLLLAAARHAEQAFLHVRRHRSSVTYQVRWQMSGKTCVKGK